MTHLVRRPVDYFVLVPQLRWWFYARASIGVVLFLQILVNPKRRELNVTPYLWVIDIFLSVSFT